MELYDLGCVPLGHVLLSFITFEGASFVQSDLGMKGIGRKPWRDPKELYFIYI